MQNVGRMHKEDASKDLIHKILDVFVSEFLARVYDSMKVGLHEVSNDVNITVSSPGLRFKDIYEAYDVLMFEKFWFRADLLRSLIYRTMRLASIRSSNALIT